MIYDTLANIGKYAAIIPHISVIRDFLSRDLASLPDGRYAIDGDNVFANISSYSTKRIEDGVFEGHRKYADIQFLIDGDELCGIVPGCEWLKENTAYDEGKDIRFFATPAAFSQVPLTTMHFAFFAPSDAHMPGIAPGAMRRVRKCVIKVKIV